MEREDAIGLTVESHCNNKNYEYYLRNFFFKDEKLTRPLFSEEEFEDLPEEDEHPGTVVRQESPVPQLDHERGLNQTNPPNNPTVDDRLIDAMLRHTNELEIAL